MVSVFDGQLTRTWFYEIDNKCHVINLYHDTITGVRSATIDYQELKGSLGNSSVLMESVGHRIFFIISDRPGFIEIKKSGWVGFSYSCFINNQQIKESTEGVAENQDPAYKIKIIDTTFTVDNTSEDSTQTVAWYVVKSIRLKDAVTTTVHRRFREFAELNSQVKQNLKGHHMRDILPPLPEKPLKILTDHRDPAFIEERCRKLEVFVSTLVAVPHVYKMVCVKAFLGIMDQVREYSVSFHVPTLGMSLIPYEKVNSALDTNPAIVGTIQKPEICKGVSSGDSISKINGVSISGTAFNYVVSRIKSLPRPIILHFVQIITERNNNLLDPMVTAASPEKSIPENNSDSIADQVVVDAVEIIDNDSTTISNSVAQTIDQSTVVNDSYKSNNQQTTTNVLPIIANVNRDLQPVELVEVDIVDDVPNNSTTTTYSSTPSAKNVNDTTSRTKSRHNPSIWDEPVVVVAPKAISAANKITTTTSTTSGSDIQATPEHALSVRNINSELDKNTPTNDKIDNNIVTSAESNNNSNSDQQPVQVEEKSTVEIVSMDIGGILIDVGEEKQSEIVHEDIEVTTVETPAVVPTITAITSTTVESSVTSPVKVNSIKAHAVPVSLTSTPFGEINTTPLSSHPTSSAKNKTTPLLSNQNKDVNNVTDKVKVVDNKTAIKITPTAATTTTTSYTPTNPIGWD